MKIPEVTGGVNALGTATLDRSPFEADHFPDPDLRCCREFTWRSPFPMEVFPSTDFPRIIVGVDNGVAPIDQMLVTVTRPIEEAVNTVPGLDRVRSITSRGTAEVNLFFHGKWTCSRPSNWSMRHWQGIQFHLTADSQGDREQAYLRSVPDHGLQPHFRHGSADGDYGSIATYELRPRLNRLNGVSTVVVQGGQEPEFEIEADPAKLVRTAVTVPALLDAIRRTNMVDSPGLMQRSHELVLALVSGQVQNLEGDLGYRGKDHTGRHTCACRATLRP